MKKRALLLSTEGTHFDSVFYEKDPNNNGLKLIKSRYSTIWTNPGSLSVHIHSDGNGYDVKLERRESIRLNYSEAYDLWIALGEMQHHTNLGPSMKIVRYRGKKK